MALTRTRIIVLGALVALIGAAVVVLAPGDKPVFQLEAARNVLRVEASGVNYLGWPDMGISVNGQDIDSVTLDSQQRKTYNIDVPNAIDSISTIEIKILNQSYCQNLGVPCDRRMILFRNLHLNDKKLEGGEPSGDDNTASLLQTAAGGITWKINE